MSVVVYVYGIPEHLHDAKTAIPPEVDEQLRLAHDLREDLVTLWQTRQDSLAAVWSSDPGIAECETRIAQAEEQAEQVGKQAAKERSAARAKGATASTASLKELRATIREARAQRRDLITVVRAARAGDLQAVEDDHMAAVKATYAQYCQQGILREERVTRLYWATYNAVLANHQAAVKRVGAARAEGRPARLRHHRYDGSGSIAVQLQRQAGVPPRTPATIRDGGKWRNVLRLTPWVTPDEWASLTRAEKRTARVGAARINVGGRRVVTLPVLVHRMLPPTADITGARLVVRRVAGRRHIELHVTAKVADPTPATAGPVVAVHLGWRHEHDQSIRVATWRSTLLVTVPAALAPWVGADTDRTGWVAIPPRWWRRVDTHDRIHAERDTALNTIRDLVVEWLSEHGPIPHPTRDGMELTAGGVRAWRAPGRFAALALAWRQHPPSNRWVGELAADIEKWRRGDRKLWEAATHGRAGAIAQRDDAYHQFTAWITTLAGKVVVDDTILAELARRPAPELDTDIPAVMAARAARARTLAAPGRLREIVLGGAGKRGVPTVTVPHTGGTRTHYRCGYLNPADDRYAAGRVVTCDGCGAGYDQDASATLMALAASGDVPPPGPGTARVAS